MRYFFLGAGWTRAEAGVELWVSLPTGGEPLLLSIVLSPPPSRRRRRLLSRFCRSAKLWQFALQLVRPGANLNPAVRDMKHPEVSCRPRL